MHSLHSTRSYLTPNQTANERTIIDDVCAAAAPHAHDYRRTEINAIERGLSRADLDGEFATPQTQLIRHRGPASAAHRAHPCVLMVHLSINSWAPRDGRPSFIGKVRWTATNNLPASPSFTSAFQYLNTFNLGVPASAFRDRRRRSPSPRRAGTLSITFSAQGISVSDGTRSLSARGSPAVDGAHHSILINYINAMRDGYFDAIYGGNVGGTNNTNSVYS
ncbi:hypothetical protein EYR36_006862 [Pleurotus pulmonarius]|nr:hypothetical protein EYR36_006862 [Pleurotus pulmonarius]